MIFGTNKLHKAANANFMSTLVR